MAELALHCHDMRSLLPCDMSIPPELWLTPPGESVTTGGYVPYEDVALAALRSCAPSDARLPYSAAMTILRTISFSRTPTEKAQASRRAAV